MSVSPKFPTKKHGEISPFFADTRVALTLGPITLKLVIEEDELNVDDKQSDVWQPAAEPYCLPMVKMN